MPGYGRTCEDSWSAHVSRSPMNILTSTAHQNLDTLSDVQEQAAKGNLVVSLAEAFEIYGAEVE